MFMLFNYFVFLILGVAAEMPRIPEPGEDRILTQSLPPTQYFDSRAGQNPTCRTQLEKTRQEYMNAKRELNRLVAAAVGTDRIETVELKINQLKESLIPLTFKCGACDMRPIKKVSIETATATQLWYVTDGSCSVHGEGSLSRYEKAKNFLNGVRNYPQYLGGFSHVLEFIAVDPKSGVLLKNLNVPETNALDIFISIRGPDILDSINSISYYFGSTFGELTKGTLKEYSIQFNSKKAPVGFQRPRVYYLPAAGRVPGRELEQRVESSQWRLKQVMGSWYVNSDGYFRYFTAADFSEILEQSFGLAELISEDLARGVLSEILFDLSEVAQGAH